MNCCPSVFCSLSHCTTLHGAVWLPNDICKVLHYGNTEHNLPCTQEAEFETGLKNLHQLIFLDRVTAAPLVSIF